MNVGGKTAMSDAYRCNGCGEYHDGTPDGTVETTLLRGDIELCLSCVWEFKTKYRDDG